MLVRRAMFGVALAGLVTMAVLSPEARSGSPMAANTWSVDSGHSSMVFRIKHMNTAYFYGRFNDLKGTVSFDEANPTASTVEVTIKTDSVDTNSSKRDGHLKSPDFFDAANFPTCTFKSTAFKAGEGTGNYEVTGDLTMHGVTKSITVPFVKTGSMKSDRGEIIGFESTFTIKRSDFGITYMPDGLGDDVRITISLECRGK